MQNNVYELVSDINARQSLIDDKVLTVEERLLYIHEQLDALPDVIRKLLITGGGQTRASLPTLIENMTSSNPNIQVPSGPAIAAAANGQIGGGGGVTVQGGGVDYSSQSYFRTDDLADQAIAMGSPHGPGPTTPNVFNPGPKYLHPNDAACLATRPSWSSTGSQVTVANPNYATSSSGTNSSKQYLSPNRTTSFDT